MTDARGWRDAVKTITSAAALTAALAMALTTALAATCIGVIAAVQQSGAPASQAKAGSADALLGAALHQEEVSGQLDAAIATYRKVLTAADATRAQKARAQFRIGACYEKLGAAQAVEARKAYEAVVAAYGDQGEFAAQAKARLGAMAESVAAIRTPQGPVLRQLMPAGGKARWHRVSPDGRMLVGVDDESANLVVRDLSTGVLRRLTDIPTDRARVDYANYPVWSKDGRHIVYEWTTDERTQKRATSVRVVDVGTGSVRVVPLDSRYRMIWPHDWSPTKPDVLATVQRVGQGETGALAWISTADGTVRIVRDSPSRYDPISASISPDGNWIVYRDVPETYGYRDTISVVPSAGGDSIPVVADSYDSRLIGWSPDGTHVVFVSRRIDAEELMTVRVTNGKPVGPPAPIRSMVGIGSLGITESGTFFYRSVQRSTSAVYKARLDPVKTEVSNVTRVCPYGIDWTTGVAWSPDGKRLAYVSFPYRRPARALSVWTAEGNHTTSFALGFDANLLSPLTWSEDGRWIYVPGRNQAGQTGLFRVSADAGTAEAVLAPESNAFPDFVRGSQRTSLIGWSVGVGTVLKRENRYTESGTPLDVRLVEHRIAGDVEREFFRTPERMGLSATAVAPDGSRVAAVLHEPGPPAKHSLVLMRTAGSEPITVAEWSAPGNYITGLRWTPDGRSVVYTLRVDYDRPAEHVAINLETGAKTRFIVPMDESREIAVSPDGREIAFIGGPREKDDGIWLLENFLPPAKK